MLRNDTYDSMFVYKIFAVLTCKASKASGPPATNSAVAVAPSISAQKTLWILGGSGSPLDVKESITSEPESDEVTKYKTIANKLKNKLISLARFQT